MARHAWLKWPGISGPPNRNNLFYEVNQGTSKNRGFRQGGGPTLGSEAGNPAPQAAQTMGIAATALRRKQRLTDLEAKRDKEYPLIGQSAWRAT